MTGNGANSAKVAADLKGLLEMLAGVMREGKVWGMKDVVYNSYEELVLREGTTYTRLRSTEGYPRGVPKRCFLNATRIVDGNPKSLTYVEGYAMSEKVTIPVEHAWAVDGEGNVVDTTWPTSDATSRAYVGLPIPHRLRMRLQTQTGVYDILNRLNATTILSSKWGYPKSGFRSWAEADNGRTITARHEARRGRGETIMTARFALGDCRATPGAIEALSEGGGDWRFNAAPFLARHQDGDWGDVDAHDLRANLAALQTGTRLLSAYTLPDALGDVPCGEIPSPAAQKIWIITEASRRETTILIPEEY